MQERVISVGRKAACLLGMALAWMPVRADWADFSRYGEVAEVAVEAGEIRLNLYIPKDFAPSDAPAARPQEVPAWLAAKLPRLLDENGKPLSASLLRLAGTEASGEERKPYFEASLGFITQARMKTLAIAPPEDRRGTAGLVVLHRGAPVCDLAPLQHPITLRLDWDDPWSSRIDDPSFARRHSAPRSYVYLEPYEVRHEALMRLKEVQPWLDFGLRRPGMIEEDERQALQHRIANLMLAHNPLAIDGAKIPPQLKRAEFVRFKRQGVVAVTEPGPLDADAVLVGVVLAYPTSNPARSISLRWDFFKEDTPRQVSLIRDKETFDGYMTSKQPDFTWSQDEASDFLPIPAEREPVAAMPGPGGAEEAPWHVLAILALILLSLTLAPGLQRRFRIGTALGLILAIGLLPSMRPFSWTHGMMAPGSKAAPGKKEVEALLLNAYQAFLLREEEKAYDRLAESLDGALLDDVYLQQRRSILQQSKGLGGEGRVDTIELLEISPYPSEGAPSVLGVAARWRVHGSVSHWGHSHDRQNLYQARLRLKAVADGRWKIVGLEFQDGHRLEPGV